MRMTCGKSDVSSTTHRERSAAAAPGIPVVAAVLLLGGAGCWVPQKPDLPEPILHLTEPATGGRYFLYVPSSYRDNRAWPLVVTCHGTPKWDTARWQIYEWSPLAERRGFLVAAPELVGTQAELWISPEEQIARQSQDEQTILAVISHIRGSRNVAEDRVFLTGWSAGNFAVLHTGLRHPEVFRALAMRQGNFDARFMRQVEPRLDRHQPIYVLTGAVDALRPQALACVEWLRDRRMWVREDEVIGPHQRHPEQAYRFFVECVKRFAWIRVEARDVPDKGPLAVAFRLVASPPAEKTWWEFGDGEGSREHAPTHVYEQPGTYTVRVVLEAAGERRFSRTIQVEVPRPQIGVRPTDPAGGP